MSINQRVEELKKFEKKQGRTFYKVVKVQSGTIGNILGERQSKPSFDVLSAIASAYPKLNCRWLLTGEGEMWLEGEVETMNSQDYKKIAQNQKELTNEVKRMAKILDAHNMKLPGE